MRIGTTAEDARNDDADGTSARREMAVWTLDQWRQFSRRDDCLDLMVPSDLRMALTCAMEHERGACADVSTKIGEALTSDCTSRIGMDPETGEQLCARRAGCECLEIIDCADAIAGKIRARSET
jgi:hypothetical protein